MITVVNPLSPDPGDVFKALRRGARIIDAVDDGSDLNRAINKLGGGGGGLEGGVVGAVRREGRTFPSDPDNFLPGRPYTPINAGRRWGPNGRIKFEYHYNDGKGYPHWHIEEKFKPTIGKSRWRKHPHYPHEFLPGDEIPEEFWDWIDKY